MKRFRTICSLLGRRGAAKGVLILTVAAVAVLPVRAEPTDPLQTGRDIYHLGKLSDGTALKAVVQSDASFDARQLACVSCHRRSGFGATEGSVTVPAITREALFAPESVYLQPRQRARSTTLTGAIRQPYDDESLASAIRDGVDADGRVMHPLMPRYALSDADMAALLEYLRTLSISPSPGVTDDELRLATVVSDDVAPQRRAAMLDVLQTFIRDKNAGTRKEYRRQKNAPWTEERMSKAFRKWQLDVWALHGAQDSWPAQLDAYYERAPVFAMLGGIVTGPWKPVHDFCEHRALPCIFPNTDLPVVDGPNGYTVYLSAGRFLEAQILARRIAEEDPATVAVIEVSDPTDPITASIAGSFRQSLPASFQSRLQELAVDPDPAVFRQALAVLLSRQKGNRRIVWWGDSKTLAAAASALAGIGEVDRIYLSGTAQSVEDIDQTLPAPLRRSVRLTYPYESPSSSAQGVLRARAWLQGKRFPLDEFVLRANSLMAATVLMETTKHMTGFYVRDLLIERLEHEVETAPSTGVFPHLSLGPAQRFASRGCYLMRLGDRVGDALQPDSDWIVPAAP